MTQHQSPQLQQSHVAAPRTVAIVINPSKIRDRHRKRARVAVHPRCRVGAPRGLRRTSTTPVCPRPGQPWREPLICLRHGRRWHGTRSRKRPTRHLGAARTAPQRRRFAARMRATVAGETGAASRSAGVAPNPGLASRRPSDTSYRGADSHGKCRIPGVGKPRDSAA